MSDAMPPHDADAIRAAVEAYFAALNRRDLDGIRAAFRFPHVLLAGGEVVVTPSAPELSFEAFWRRVDAQGWTHSVLDGLAVLMAAPDKAHVEIRFTRRRADGSAIGAHRSLYVFVRDAAGWGIQARSSHG